MVSKESVEYSVVVPIFNSERSISELYHRLVNVLEKLNENFEIILIDDGSKDKSWEIMLSIHGKDKRVKIIQLMRNFGQHNALMCGFNHVSGNYVITMDDDLQHPPEEIPKLINKIKMSNADAVIGKPFQKQHSIFKNIGSYILNELYTIVLKKPKNVKVGSFCVISRNIVSKIVREKTTNPMLNALLLQNTLNILNEPTIHRKRKYGRTSYSIPKLLTICYNLVINYSSLPLKIISVIGFIFSFLGLIGLIYVLIRALLGKIGVAGWASIVILVFLFGGLILFSFGIVGEYLIRILQGVSHQEQFKVRRVLQ